MNEFIHGGENALRDVWYWIVAAAIYCYRSQSIRIALYIAVATIVLALFVRSYIAYRKGWVSLLIEKRLADMHRARVKQKRRSLPTFKSVRFGLRGNVLAGVHNLLE